MPTQVYEQAPTPYASNPIIPLVSGWYVSQVYDPVVMIDPLDSTKLRMYVSGMAAPVQSGIQSIGLFTASRSNPITGWTSAGQVLTPYGPYHDVRNGTVIYSGGTFYLFYTGINGSTLEICLATCTDGVTFVPSGSNPILTPTGQGRNDGTQVEDPAVCFDGTNWLMVYSYRNGATTLPGFRVATASTPTSWTKAGSGDVLTTAPLYGEWHQISKIGDTYVLTYEAGSTTVPYKIFQATSLTPTGAYTDIAQNPVLAGSGVPGSWDRYHVATPWMMQIDGQWLMYYCAAGNHDQPYGTNTWPMGVAEYTVATTTFVFNAGMAALTSGGTTDLWASGTIKARRVANSVTPLIDDTSMTGYTAQGADATLGSKTKTVVPSPTNRTVFSAANATITGVGVGDVAASIVVFLFNTDDAGSTPLFCLSLSPESTSLGGSEVISWDPATGCGFTEQL